MVSKRIVRTWVGVLLALPVLAVVVGLWACLPVPVGDPEKSKVDDKLIGAWVAKDGDEKTVYVVQTWDPRTYVVRCMNYTGKKGAWEAKGEMLTFKGWLTELGGARFLVLEPKSVNEVLEPAKKDERIWVVMKIKVENDKAQAWMINPESTLTKNVKTREEAEKILAEHADDKALYGDDGKNLELKRAGDDLKEELGEVFKDAYHLGDLKMK